MGRIVFVPNSLAQAQKFSFVIGKLPAQAEYLIVIMDRFKSDSVREYAERRGVPHVELGGIDAASIRGLLEKERAGIVVLGNDVEVISAGFVDAAKEMRIPSLLMQDGTICPHNYVLPVSLDFVKTALAIYGPLYLLTQTLPNMLAGKIRKKDELYRYGTNAKYVAAWGGYSKRMFVELGAKKENVLVTGSPAMDSAMAGVKGGRKKIYAELGLDATKKTMLFMPSDLLGGRLYTRKEYEDTCDAVCGAAKAGGFQMIIKPHPSFIRREPHFFDKYISNGMRLSYRSPYELLGVVDAAVGEISTMLLEAVAFGLPIVVVNMTGRAFPSDPYPAIYPEQGVAMLADSREKAVQAMKDALFSKEAIAMMKKQRTAFIEDQLYRLDGKSAERVAGLIMRLMRRV